MARNIIKSNTAIVATQDSTTAWSYNQEDLVIFKLAQNFEYSISFPNQSAKQLGAQSFAYQEMISQPDVSLNLSYIPEPNFSNEERGRFLNSTSDWTDGFKNLFDSPEGADSNNFYVLVEENQGVDFLDTVDFAVWLNLSGVDAIAFGNCYPTSYNLNYAVGTLPVVSTRHICSNIVFDHLTGNSMGSPAINLTGGNNDGAGRINFEFQKDLSTAALEKTPPVVNPTDPNSSITLQNLQVGGQNISGVHFVQSVDMVVDLPRVSDYGLGSDFAYGRKPQFPAQGSFNVASLVSGFDNGAITGVLNNNEDYSFELVLASGSLKMAYQVEGAKLDSVSYTMPVNNWMTFSAAFSFEVTQTKGLKLSGTYY